MIKSLITDLNIKPSNVKTHSGIANNVVLIEPSLYTVKHLMKANGVITTREISLQILNVYNYLCENDYIVT